MIRCMIESLAFVTLSSRKSWLMCLKIVCQIHKLECPIKPHQANAIFLFRPESLTCAFGWAQLGFMNFFFFKFMDP